MKNLVTTYYSTIPVWTIAVSLVTVFLIMLSSKRKNLREMWTVIAAFIKFFMVLSLLPSVLAGKIATIRVLEISPGMELLLKADSFGVFFALIASGLWIVTSFYSMGYMRGLNEEKQTRFFASFALCLSSTIGVAFSGNLLTFVIFYELLTLATYPLVIHKETKAAREGGRKYLIYTLTAGVLLMAATGITYNLTGNIDFQAGGILGNVALSPKMGIVLFLLFLAGLGVKAGIMPVHGWLPSAMVAPTPVSALLHAVAVVKAGVFGIVRVSGFIFGPEIMGKFGLDQILFVVAGITILISSILALKQTNLKKRLAYSTVGHLSYIILGVALLTPEGMTGSLLHIAFHATMKITLFFCAGAIYVHLHKQNIYELDGVGRQMPWTLGAFTICTFGLMGVPPINGFISKWYLLLGAGQSTNYWGILILITSGVLNAAYFLPISYRAFFKKNPDIEGKGEASPLMVVPISITAALSVFLGLNPNFMLKIFHQATQIAENIFKGAL